MDTTTLSSDVSMFVDVFVVVTVDWVSPVDVAGVTLWLLLLLDEVETDPEEFEEEEVDGVEEAASVAAEVDKFTGILFELDELLAVTAADDWTPLGPATGPEELLATAAAGAAGALLDPAATTGIAEPPLTAGAALLGPAWAGLAPVAGTGVMLVGGGREVLGRCRGRLLLESLFLCSFSFKDLIVMMKLSWPNWSVYSLAV